MNKSDEDGSRGVYDAMREWSKAKKQRNQKESTALLRERGFVFTAANGGIHLIIRHCGRVFDFWPSTGKWRERMDDTKAGSFLMTNQCRRDGRGVFNLLKVLDECTQRSNIRTVSGG